MAQVIVKRSAIAEFLDTIPKMIWDAKMNKSNQEFEADQKQLDREYQTKADSLNFKRDVAKDVWNRKNAISDSLDQLGLISDANENLSGEDTSGNAPDFLNRLQSSYSEGEDSLDSLISDMRSEMDVDRIKIASYNKGKNFFTQVDVNSDGTISPVEKEKFIDQYHDKWDSWDKGAFTEGLYSGEIDASKKAELALSQATVYEANMRNKYLESTLISDEQQRGLTLDMTSVQIEKLNKEVELQDYQMQKANLEISLAKLNLDKFETEVEKGIYDLDMQRDTELRASIENNELIYMQNANTIALNVLQNISFTNTKGTKILPLWNILMTKAGGDSGEFLTAFEDLDVSLGAKRDYIDRFDYFTDHFGADVSILPDIKGIINATQIGWNNETAMLETSEPLLTSIIAIKDEIDLFKETEVGKNAEAILEIFRRKTGMNVWENPDEFADYMEDPDMATSYSVHGFTTEDLHSILRYAQFKQIGLTKLGILDQTSAVMNGINKSENLKKILNNKVIDYNFK